MNNWKEAALDALHRSIQPVPQELNEIDWKGGLSSKTDRLAQHTFHSMDSFSLQSKSNIYITY